MITEIFRQGQRQIGCLAAHQRAFIRCGHDHDTARQAVRAQIILNEFLNFAPAFADQPDHRHIGGGIAGQHRQQHRLTHAGACENTHALTAACSGEAIERPHPEINPLPHPRPLMGRQRLCAQQVRLTALGDRALAVDGLAHGIHHPPQPCRGRMNDRFRRIELGRRSHAQAFNGRKRHRQCPVVPEAHHLARHRLVTRPGHNHAAAQAQRRQRPFEFDHQPAHRGNRAVMLDGGQALDFGKQRLHVDGDPGIRSGRGKTPAGEG